MSLLGRSRKRDKDVIVLSDSQMCIETVLNAYLEALKGHVNSQYVFRVASELPYSKELIKGALISFLKVSADPETQDKIKFFLEGLCAWQEHLEHNVERMDIDDAENKLTDKYKEYVECGRIFRVEADTIKRELSSLGL
jgi:hypothetical protein